MRRRLVRRRSDRRGCFRRSCGGKKFSSVSRNISTFAAVSSPSCFENDVQSPTLKWRNWTANLRHGTMEPGHCRITGAMFPFMDINTRRPNRHLCAAAIPKSRALYQSEGAAMKKLLVAGLVAGAFVSVEARAEDRAGDAALGAVSGAVVLGPVGAVAGAVIGYTVGPSIARSWGLAIRLAVSRSTYNATRKI